MQREIDISSRGLNQVEYIRRYSNSNKIIGGAWYNNYQKSLIVIEAQKIETMRAKSAPYADKSAACKSGFNDLKAKIFDDWVQGASAQFVNNSCHVIRNNKIIRRIPVMPNSMSIDVHLKPGAIQLIREDGTIFNFELGVSNQYNSLNDEKGKLLAIENEGVITWRFNTPNGNVEEYSDDGRLLSITASNGMKQELFYDAASGLLLRVKDSIGRELLFGYTGNQISSVTVDGNKKTSYTYNTSGLITQVTRPDNTVRIYHYEDSRFPTYLTGITNELGPVNTNKCVRNQSKLDEEFKNDIQFVKT